MNNKDKVFNSFPLFIENVIFPMLLKNPNHERLDGKISGGNRDIGGRFKFKDRIWKIHMDTHYEPLLLAYYSWKYKKGERTFVEKRTNSLGLKLVLADDINGFRDTRHSYLYIYSE